MKVLVLGMGKIGGWLAKSLRSTHEVVCYDKEKTKIPADSSVKILGRLEEIAAFAPELMVNAVSLQNTRRAFHDVLPYLSQGCVLSDIASVKTGLGAYYTHLGRRFVSTHPMFGPVFGDIGKITGENALIIQESDEEGKRFFREFYTRLGLRIFECTFEEHDRAMASALSVPFACSMAFCASLQGTEVPGTTFKRHLEIARGLLSEDDHLLSQIMFNPHSIREIETLNSRLAYLVHILRDRDQEEMETFLERLRRNLQCHRGGYDLHTDLRKKDG